MTRFLTTIVIAAGLTFSITSPAFAASSDSSRLATVKTRCDSAVQNRLSQITTLTTTVNNSKAVTASHKSGLLAELASDKTGLTALDSTIQADTTAAQAVTDCKGIVSSYRIYVLEVPKVHEVLAADAVAQVGTTLQTVSPKVAEQITAAKNNGKDVSAAETALADLNSKTATINNTAPGLAGPVLALQPSGWPGNKSTVQSTRQTIGSLVTTAKSARQDLKTISSVVKAK